nr:hypothetical protein [Tanacetum cinerariifolium]
MGDVGSNEDSSFGPTILSNQFSVDAERFAVKLKKGSEEVALKMEYVPSAVSKMENGNKRIMFSVEEGMKSLLESGPWMVQNVPLVLNVWELGIWLEKTKPSSIPIWVCVHNIPMELCNGNGIGKIMSGIGKPMLMDRMMKDRCLKKAGKLDFARVLVEVSANEELPNVLEIAYPPIWWFRECLNLIYRET